MLSRGPLPTAPVQPMPESTSVQLIFDEVLEQRIRGSIGNDAGVEVAQAALRSGSHAFPDVVQANFLDVLAAQSTENSKLHGGVVADSEEVTAEDETPSAPGPCDGEISSDAGVVDMFDDGDPVVETAVMQEAAIGTELAAPKESAQDPLPLAGLAAKAQEVLSAPPAQQVDDASRPSILDGSKATDQIAAFVAPLGRSAQSPLAAELARLAQTAPGAVSPVAEPPVPGPVAITARAEPPGPSQSSGLAVAGLAPFGPVLTGSEGKSAGLQPDAFAIPVANVSLGSPQASSTVVQNAGQTIALTTNSWIAPMVSGPVLSLFDAAGGRMVIDIAPEELGRLTITLTVQGETAIVRFQTETPEAARILADAERHLSAELAKFGMALAGHDATPGRKQSGDHAAHHADRSDAPYDPANLDAKPVTSKTIVNLIA